MAKRKNGALTYGRKEKLAGGTEARYNPGASVNKRVSARRFQSEEQP